MGRGERGGGFQFRDTGFRQLNHSEIPDGPPCIFLCIQSEPFRVGGGERGVEIKEGFEVRVETWFQGGLKKDEGGDRSLGVTPCSTGGG